MIPDRTQLNTLYIKTDDGEYQELGKTTSVEYECAVEEIPTLRLELRCTYEQNKKEKEVKEMSYDELVKKLPKIEIDGVPIEYGKTKVIYTYDNIDYEGLIIYNDGSGGNELIFLSDERCADFNDELTCIDSDIKRVLTRTFDEKNLEYRNFWVYITDLKLAPKKTELRIDANGITLKGNGNIICSTVYEPFNYVSYDTSITKDFYEKSCLGMWNTEEEKERGNKMELINIYKEKSLENIEKYFEKEEKDYLESNEIRKQFEAIINEANEKIKKLYESQNLFEESLYKITEKSQPAYDDINYVLFHKFSDSGITNIREKHTKINNELYETLNEVQAQIECIEDHSENEYEEIMRVLKDYGIVDEKGKVTPYQIKKLHLHNDLDDDNHAKRGRKPKKSE